MKKFETLTELDILYAAYSNILEKWVREIDHKAKLIKNGFTTGLTDARLKKINRQINELQDEIVRLEGIKFVEFNGNVYEVYEHKERTTVLMGGDGFTIELPNDYFETLTTLTEADISRSPERR